MAGHVDMSKTLTGRQVVLSPGAEGEGNVMRGKAVRHALVATPTGYSMDVPSRAHAGNRGLRLQDELLDHRRSGVTSCASRQFMRPVSLTRRNLVRALFCCTVIAGMALLHIQLQFSISDNRLVQQRMQTVHRKLMQEHARLESANAALSDYKRIYHYARVELGMEEIQERPVAYLPKGLKEKYTSTAVASGVKHGSDRTVASLDLSHYASTGLERLLDFGRAAIAGQLER